MIVLSHRGYWEDVKEKNTNIAFERSFDRELGTETDVRDFGGRIVISHDMPRGDEISFEEVLQIMDGRNLPLALNIKADGLITEIKKLLEQYNHTNYFTFDMSIPDMVSQVKEGTKVFTGISDIMPTPVLFEQAEGVWLDCFNSDWYDSSLIDDLLSQGKKICVVSADLHKRDITKQWTIIKQCKQIGSRNLMLCTDTPLKAKEFFNV